VNNTKTVKHQLTCYFHDKFSGTGLDLLD